MFRNILENPDIPLRNWKLMYLDNSNLSAEHVKKLKFAVSNYDVKRDKFGLTRALITEGVDMPRGFDIDKLYMRINACIRK